MSMPPDMAGMTVACAHCKQPFQIPEIAPAVFAEQIPEGPRRRSAGRPPGSNPWVWLAIGLPCAGVLIALLFVWRGSGLTKSLEKGQLVTLYQEIKNGMTAEEAEKRVQALLAKVPGQLKEPYETGEEDEQTYQKVFEKGKVRIVLFLNRVTNQVVNKHKDGF